MTTFTFSNVTPGQILALKLKLSNEAVVESNGNVTTISGHGVKASAVYENGNLTVTIVSKPFYVNTNMIHSQIMNALKSE